MPDNLGATIKKGFKRLVPTQILKLRERELHKETHINRALDAINGQTYVEIGIARGDCFRQIVAPRKIGIDPAPVNFGLGLAAGESFFKMTSDTFFAEHAKQLFKGREVDVAFVDGLHEFSQVLRDVLNLEKYMSKRGVIFIHDCNPPDRRYADEGVGAVWTGDVWKVCHYLTTSRPDLSFFTLDCDWGLGVLTGFQSTPKSGTVPLEGVDDCKLLDYSYFEGHRGHTLRLHTVLYSKPFFNLIHSRRIRHTANGMDGD